MGQPRPLFHVLLSFRTENFSSQQDSNSDRRSRGRERWPLDHHHGHRILKLLMLVLVKIKGETVAILWERGNWINFLFKRPFFRTSSRRWRSSSSATGAASSRPSASWSSGTRPSRHSSRKTSGKSKVNFHFQLSSWRCELSFRMFDDDKSRMFQFNNKYKRITASVLTQA